jgi:hypothetical protein
MKLAAALILAACTVGASAALEPRGEFTVTMNPAQQALCKAQGGCIVLTRRAIEDLTAQSCPKGTGI